MSTGSSSLKWLKELLQYYHLFQVQIRSNFNRLVAITKWVNHISGRNNIHLYKNVNHIYVSHFHFSFIWDQKQNSNTLFIQQINADAQMWVICYDICLEAWKPPEAINTEWFMCSCRIANSRSWPADRQTNRGTQWLKESSNIQGVKAYGKSL